MNYDELYYINITRNVLNIKRSNIIHLLGYKDIKKINKNIIKKIDYYIKKCIDICKAQGSYILKNKIRINQKNESVKLNNITLKIGKKIAEQLKYSESLVLFLCTAGEEIENFSKKLLDNNEYLEGYLVDLIGSEIAETVAGFIHKEVINKFKSNSLKGTNWFSPGYCEWDVFEQHKLFKIFPENICNISLTEKGLMNPIKSVSGIIGIGKNVTFSNYKCELCNQKSCKYRIINNKKM
jgi:hypothetical protein